MAQQKRGTPFNGTQIKFAKAPGTPATAITQLSTANPAVATVASHGLKNGDVVLLASESNPAVNGLYVAAQTDTATKFTVVGLDGSAVGAVSDGSYTVTGPIYTGQRCSMGRAVWLDVGGTQIVVVEQPHEPWDLGVFSCVGLDPTAYRYLLLKSRMYCRPVFVPLSAGLVECDSPGVTTSDYARFAFTRVHRPVYPLDPI